MQASKAAQIFHDWALTEGLMSESPEPTHSTPAELALVSPSFEAGKTTLRQKRILAVGFNEAAHEIIAYTKNAAPSGKKALDSVPSRVDDVRVRYRQGNHSSAGDSPSMPFGGPPFVVRNVAQALRYACGSSISVGNCVDAGTLGALVRDASGKMFGISNNHVSGSCSHAEVGLPVVAPGIADVAAGSLYPFTLGLHKAALPLVIGSPSVVAIADNTDAAMFEILNEDAVTSFQGNAYDTPSTTMPLQAGLNVEKVGRTTGHTSGYVDSELYGPVSVNYAAGRYGFSGRIFFNRVHVIRGISDVFSDNGDSGSLITAVDNGVRHAVGIVFAGNQDAKAPGGKITLALPLDPILSALGVTLVSGHHV